MRWLRPWMRNLFLQGARQVGFGAGLNFDDNNASCCVNVEAVVDQPTCRPQIDAVETTNPKSPFSPQWTESRALGPFFIYYTFQLTLYWSPNRHPWGCINFTKRSLFFAPFIYKWAIQLPHCHLPLQPPTYPALKNGGYAGKQLRFRDQESNWLIETPTPTIQKRLCTTFNRETSISTPYHILIKTPIRTDPIQRLFSASGWFAFWVSLHNSLDRVFNGTWSRSHVFFSKAGAGRGRVFTGIEEVR